MQQMAQFKIEDSIFNLRTAGLAQKGDKYLFIYYPEIDTWSLPGGRCNLHEDSITALKREYLEETATEISVLKFLAVVENFFQIAKRQYHEILLVHEVALPECSKLYQADEFQGKEQETTMLFKWLAKTELYKYPIKPQVLLKIIEHPGHISHFLANDLQKRN